MNILRFLETWYKVCLVLYKQESEMDNTTFSNIEKRVFLEPKKLIISEVMIIAGLLLHSGVFLYPRNIPHEAVLVLLSLGLIFVGILRILVHFIKVNRYIFASLAKDSTDLAQKWKKWSFILFAVCVFVLLIIMTLFIRILS